MKKILFVLAVLMAGVGSMYAQSIRFGITGGLNSSNINLERTNKTYSTDPRIGFNAGIKSEIGFVDTHKGPYLNAALLYSVKGAKLTEDTDFKMNYLELPVHLGYKFGLGDNFGLFVHAGPYAAYGLSSNVTWGGISVNVFDTKDEKTFGIDRFDAGVSASVGVELARNLQISLDYSKGLTNIMKSSSDNDKFTNSNLSVSVAYMF